MKYPRIEALLKTANALVPSDSLPDNQLLLLLPILRWIKPEYTLKLIESLINQNNPFLRDRAELVMAYNQRASELEEELRLIPQVTFDHIINKLSKNRSEAAGWQAASKVKDNFAEIKASQILLEEGKGTLIPLSEKGADFAIVNSTREIIELIEVKLCHFPYSPRGILRCYIFSLKDFFKKGSFLYPFLPEFFNFSFCFCRGKKT